MRTALAIGALAVCASAVIGAQAPTMTSTAAGIEMILIQPGSFVLGTFQPPYPKPPDPNATAPAGRGAAAGGGTALAPGMTTADTNADARISRAEFSALANTWFAMVDPGRAGAVSQQEFAQRFTVSAPSGGQAPPDGGRGAGAGGGGGRGGRGGANVAPVLFTAADANKNGSLTLEELSATLDRWFMEWDKAKTGALDAAAVVAGLNTALPMPPAGGRGGTPLTAEEYRRIEAAAKADSTPGFRATITRPYYIGKYEVTQAQWRRVMGNNPSTFQGTKVQGSSDDHPVDSVSWDDAQAFVRRLNTMEKTTRYRLPTEFEWEYAARAGAEGDIAWTDIRLQAWAASNRSTQAVGKLKPNAWGLHDTLGNVWEWVQDYYNEKLFADPVPPKAGREHVLKGAGFVGDVKNATWMTHAAGPGSKFDVGFRIVRDVGN